MTSRPAERVEAAHSLARLRRPGEVALAGVLGGLTGDPTTLEKVLAGDRFSVTLAALASVGNEVATRIEPTLWALARLEPAVRSAASTRRASALRCAAAEKLARGAWDSDVLRGMRPRRRRGRRARASRIARSRAALPGAPRGVARPDAQPARADPRGRAGRSRPPPGARGRGASGDRAGSLGRCPGRRGDRREPRAIAPGARLRARGERAPRRSRPVLAASHHEPRAYDRQGRRGCDQGRARAHVGRGPGRDPRGAPRCGRRRGHPRRPHRGEGRVRRPERHRARASREGAGRGGRHAGALSRARGIAGVRARAGPPARSRRDASLSRPTEGRSASASTRGLRPSRSLASSRSRGRASTRASPFTASCPGFVAQLGDRGGDGYGGSGALLRCETAPVAFDSLRRRRGPRGTRHGLEPALRHPRPHARTSTANTRGSGAPRGTGAPSPRATSSGRCASRSEPTRDPA